MVIQGYGTQRSCTKCGVASHPIKDPDYATLNGNTILQIAPDGESGTDTRLDQVT